MGRGRYRAWQQDAAWRIDLAEIETEDPPVVLGACYCMAISRYLYKFLRDLAFFRSCGRIVLQSLYIASPNRHSRWPNLIGKLRSSDLRNCHYR